jgi:hypothetical protein
MAYFDDSEFALMQMFGFCNNRFEINRDLEFVVEVNNEHGDRQRVKIFRIGKDMATGTAVQSLFILFMKHFLFDNFKHCASNQLEPNLKRHLLCNIIGQHDQNEVDFTSTINKLIQATSLVMFLKLKALGTTNYSSGRH